MRFHSGILGLVALSPWASVLAESDCRVVRSALSDFQVLGPAATEFCGSYLNIPETTSFYVTQTPTRWVVRLGVLLPGPLTFIFQHPHAHCPHYYHGARLELPKDCQEKGCRRPYSPGPVSRPHPFFGLQPPQHRPHGQHHAHWHCVCCCSKSGSISPSNKRKGSRRPS